jgi:MscS family membrane protein
MLLVVTMLLAQAGDIPEENTPAAQPPYEMLETLLHRIDVGRTIEQTTWVGWLVLFLAIFLGIVIGKLVQAALRAAAGRLTTRGWITRGMLVGYAAGPAHLLLITIGLSIGLSYIALSGPLIGFTARLLALLYIITLGWFLYNLVNLVDLALQRFTRRTISPLDDMLVPLIRKSLRLFLLVVLVLFTAENVFGANVTAWLAGLGIAGLAVSLAAQDSIKNLFGSITILLDRPFAIGDRVVVDGHDGPVEQIGFRSTKIRTMAGELVTIPNSKVVDGSVLNIGKRLNFRRVLNLSLTYDTPPEKLEQAVQIVRAILAEPDIVAAFDLEKFPPRVYFNDFRNDHLNLWVIYWYFPPTDWWAYMDHTQKVNLKIIRGFSEAGIDFAFPTQTMYLAGDRKREMSLRLLERDGSPGS